ncbi:hypothetical protein RclHR1_10520001 [Rhizophagus clarus]|uniref:Uncharacterized protein n=1 Tax=Rhizophagus clarus TaxID=94130 RepID=A0A2Z6Q1T8_9GLOM|nr:hypothetical protein RclHR1_10520001 [Rhizophagus clarus]
MSEQNYTKTILVSAFQDEFLLEILARLHISKNTKHTGSDSISKIQNFNLKQTEVFEDQNSILRQTGLFQRSGTPIRNRPKSETPFQGRPLSPELHFKVWNSTLRRTTNLEADRYFKVQKSFIGELLSGTSFRGRLLSKKNNFFYFNFTIVFRRVWNLEVDQYFKGLEVLYRRTTVWKKWTELFQRSRTQSRPKIKKLFFILH